MKLSERIKIWKAVKEWLDEDMDFICCALSSIMQMNVDDMWLEDNMPEFYKYRKDACKGKTGEEIEDYGWFGNIYQGWGRRKEVVNEIIKEL